MSSTKKKEMADILADIYIENRKAEVEPLIERAALGDEAALCELCRKLFYKCPASGTQMMELGTCRGALLHVCKKYVASGGENIKKRLQ